MNGALWCSGAVTAKTSPGPPIRSRSARAVTSSVQPAAPATMIFGRPVLPPDVGAFQLGGSAAGSGSGERAGSGVQVGGSDGRSAASRPTTSGAPAMSTSAASSAGGSFADTGWGTAPSFQTPSTAA